MADRIARKDMGKRFRLSTELSATLQRKHDWWSPYRAYSRVENELSVFRALCQILLSFFQMPAATTENDEVVGFNRRAVKMFADLIKWSLRDDDFVSCKCTTFNAVLCFYYRIRFLLMVRFVNDFLFIFFPFFCYRRCTLDTGLLSGEEMRQITPGAIVQGSQEENEMAIKVCLKLITMFCNMSNVRVGATDSALQYLLNNCRINNFKSNLNFKRKSTFITSSDDDDSSTAADDGESTGTAGKCCKVTTMDVNEGAGKVDKTIDVDVVVPNEYELHDFLITD